MHKTSSNIYLANLFLLLYLFSYYLVNLTLSPNTSLLSTYLYHLFLLTILTISAIIITINTNPSAAQMAIIKCINAVLSYIRFYYCYYLKKKLLIFYAYLFCYYFYMCISNMYSL